MGRTCLLASLAVVIGAVVLPSTALGQLPTQDSVRADQQGFPFMLHIEALSGPAGENPGGTFTAHIGGGNGTGYALSVTCLSVTGNEAIIGVTGNTSAGGSYLPLVGLVRVVDGGDPGSQLDTFNAALRGVGFPTPVPPEPLPGPTACSDFPNGFPPNLSILITSGDITVVDAPPLEASKDQCKNGGWRNYPGFKNEGACVSFVATRGKRPPS